MVIAISNFKKLDDELAIKISDNVFNFLSQDEYGRGKFVRGKFVEKKTALFALLALLRCKDRSTHVIVCRTICNLLCFAVSQKITVEEVSDIDKLERIANLGDSSSEMNCANTFFLMSGSKQNREMMVDVNAFKIIIFLVRSPNMETRWSSINVIANLSQDPDTREDLLNKNVILSLVALTEVCNYVSLDIKKVVAQSFCNLPLRCLEEIAVR